MYCTWIVGWDREGRRERVMMRQARERGRQATAQLNVLLHLE